MTNDGLSSFLCVCLQPGKPVQSVLLSCRIIVFAKIFAAVAIALAPAVAKPHEAKQSMRESSAMQDCFVGGLLAITIRVYPWFDLVAARAALCSPCPL